MRGYIVLILFLGMLAVWMNSCAVQAHPTGGPEDNTSPMPIAAKSSPNQALNFKKQDIYFEFDEWVNLKNKSQILVSPPLRYPLDIKLSGKRLILKFDEREVLHDQTTYTINLGESIHDITESNAIQNYTYVFSTGPFIDSLSIHGSVVDAWTGKSVEGAIVALYANLQDTAFTNERPLYFTKTDLNGGFTLNNIRADQFNVFALVDNNLNYYYDLPNERIAFLSEPIQVDTSFTSKLQLELFQEKEALKIETIEQRASNVLLLFNGDLVDGRIELFDGAEDLRYLAQGDSMVFWHQFRDTTKCIVRAANEPIDTITVFPISDSLNLRWIGTKELDCRASSFFSMDFTQAIQQIELQNIVLRDSADQQVQFQAKIDTLIPNRINLRGAWSIDQKYNLTLLPGALVGINQQSNDSIQTEINILDEALFGELIVQLDSLDKNYQYIVELSKGAKKIHQRIQAVESHTMNFKGLVPGQYKARIIEDKNKNGRWDPGQYATKTQSERWVEKPLQALKANWTLELKVYGNKFEK